MANCSLNPVIISRQEAIANKLDRYYSGQPCKNGHHSERYVKHYACIECTNRRSQKTSELHPERRKQITLKSKLKPTTRFGSLCCWARNRAKKYGREFDEALIQHLKKALPTRCACCNKVLDFLILNGRTGNSPSLDRIDNNIGYTTENTKVICDRCNLIKNAGSAAEHEMIAKYMRKYRVT